MIRELNYRVVEQEGEERIVHIENVSYDLARFLADMLNDKSAFSFFIVEEME